MPRPMLYDESQINLRMKKIPFWEKDGTTIVRQMVFPNFAAAVGIFNSIALIAEKMDHHPDIFLYGWNKLKITSSTHDQGGLTELDFDLAEQIDALEY